MATFALLFWPVIALVIFARLKAARGLIWSVMIGYLFLPEAIELDLPGLPPFDKSGSIAVGAVLGVLLFRDPKPATARQARPGFTLILGILGGILLLSPVMTVLQNPDTLINTDVVRKGLSFSDLRSMVFSSMVTFVPFILAYRVIHHRDHYREILVSIVVLGMFYTLLALVEMRMSPQMNIWVYGYFQSEWYQHERGGAYRPLVFLRHGLWLGFFLLTALLAALTLSHRRDDRKTQYLLSALWLLLILFLSRNLGATILALLIVPMLFFFKTQTQVRLAAAMAIFFFIYPVVRASDMSPANFLVEWTRAVSPDRAASLWFRLSNEDRLIERAMERPVFGWGIWGRARVLNERGIDLSVTDGIWIVVLGKRGWAGYLAQFGILLLPLVFLARRNKTGPPLPEIAGMALIMGANFLYMIPNSTLSPIGMLITGTLAASLRAAHDTDPDGVHADKATAPRAVRYSRFSGPTVKIADTGGAAMPTDRPTSRGSERYKRV